MALLCLVICEALCDKGDTSPRLQGQKQRSSAVENPQREGCGYSNSQHTSKHVMKGRTSSGFLSCRIGRPRCNMLTKVRETTGVIVRNGATRMTV